MSPVRRRSQFDHADGPAPPRQDPGPGIAKPRPRGDVKPNLWPAPRPRRRRWSRPPRFSSASCMTSRRRPNSRGLGHHVVHAGGPIGCDLFRPSHWPWSAMIGVRIRPFAASSARIARRRGGAVHHRHLDVPSGSGPSPDSATRRGACWAVLDKDGGRCPPVSAGSAAPAGSPDYPRRPGSAAAPPAPGFRLGGRQGVRRLGRGLPVPQPRAGAAKTVKGRPAAFLALQPKPRRP